ncbi:MAG: polyprenyl synthetase family protein, partial [Candidatus Omnitrophota bacterium]
MDINKYIARKKNIIDSALDLYIPPASARPAVIHKAMRYAVFPGGKRIRPILTITAFEACGGKGDSILPVACAMELIHCYALV